MEEISSVAKWDLFEQQSYDLIHDAIKNKKLIIDLNYSEVFKQKSHHNRNQTPRKNLRLKNYDYSKAGFIQ
jgi:hypothetical protein